MEENSSNFFFIYKGMIRSDETKRLISERTKGRVPWNKGLTKDDPRIAEAHNKTTQTRKMNGSYENMVPWNKGLKK